MKKTVRLFYLCFLLVILFCLSVVVIGCGPVEYDMSGIKLNDQTRSYTGKPQRPLLSFTEQPTDLPQLRYEYFFNGKSVESATLPGTYTVRVLFDVDTKKYKPVTPLEATMTINFVGSKFSVASSNYQYFTIRSESEMAFVEYSGDVYVWKAHIQQLSETSWSIVPDASSQFDFHFGRPSNVVNTLLEIQEDGTVKATQTNDKDGSSAYTLTPQS